MARKEESWRWISKLITGYFRSGPGYSCWRSRGTGDWLLTYTFDGLGRYGHALGEVICRPGELVLLRPRVLHDYGVEPSKQYWEFVWAHFHPRAEWLDWLSWPEEAPGLMRLDLARAPQRERVAKRFVEAHELSTAGERRASDLGMNALEEVLLWCDDANPRQQVPIDARVRAAMTHCFRNLASPLSLGGLATVCGLSPSRLSFLFKAQVGMAPMRWLEHQRLARAKDLLEATVEPIQTVAEQVGYSDAFHFSSRFRQALGMSPRAWRQAAQERSGTGSHD